MAVMTIATGNPSVDGDYTVDFAQDSLTIKELSIIKKISGVRAGEIQEALAAGDMELLVAWAVIFLRREGRDERMSLDILMESNATSAVRFDVAEEDRAVEAAGDAVPPASAPLSETPSSVQPGERPSGESSSSGDNGASASQIPVSLPASTGGPI